MSMKKTYDVIAIGELNADLILNEIAGEPEIGKEIFAGNMILTLGSSTAIFAANIASLGAKTGFVGMIGKDSFGDLVRKSLADKQVDTSMLIEHPTLPTGVTVVLNYQEDRANVTYQGPMDVMSFNDIDEQVFEQTRHIHISSIFMQSGIQRDLFEILAYARSKGVTTSLDTQWDPRETWKFDYARILPQLSVFLPNEKELKLLTRSSSLDEAVDKIKPYINICVVKRGSRGSLLLLPDGTMCERAAFLNTEVVDAIGAGDSFNSGFISQYVQGKSLVECQYFGNLTGALNTTAAGGTGAFGSKEQLIKVAKEKFNQDISWL